MVRIPTPIPPAIWRSVTGLFRGSYVRIVWKLLVLVVGLGGLIYIGMATSSWLVLTVVGLLLTFAISSTARKAAMNIWNMQFKWIKI